MKFLKYFYLLLSVVPSCNSCKDDCPEDLGNGEYLFEVPVSLDPVKTNYHVGDTLTVTSFFNDNVIEHRSGGIYKLEDFDFMPATGFYYLDTARADTFNDPIIRAVTAFELVAVDEGTYEFNNQDYVYRGEYTYDSSHYALQIRFVMLQPGLFVMGHSCIGARGRSQNFAGQCPDTDVSAITIWDPPIDHNLHLLAESPDWFWRKYYEEGEYFQQRFKDDGFFAFRVVP